MHLSSKGIPRAVAGAGGGMPPDRGLSGSFTDKKLALLGRRACFLQRVRIARNAERCIS